MAYMSVGQYTGLRITAKSAENVERVLLATEGQIRAFSRDGFHWPPEAQAWADARLPELRLVRDRQMRALMKLAKGSPLYEWAQETTGIGPALFFLAGLIPPLGPLDGDTGEWIPFHSPSALWKYVGLDVRDGKAPKRERGTMAGFNVRLRAYAIARVALPCVKQTASPYRAIYDARKAYTLTTHPPMVDEGCEWCDKARGKSATLRAGKQQERERTTVAFDCANVGGIHWKDGHRHADALRVMAKAILLDAWRVANGMPAKVGASAGLTPKKPTPSLAGA